MKMIPKYKQLQLEKLEKILLKQSQTYDRIECEGVWLIVIEMVKCIQMSEQCVDTESEL